ncbi:hypothetical protein CGC20_0345 [Leishmania donovani]|uniref:Uncharacterized protein n=1 Tax=Leishmania donovani TaxID=5661 RepID=A0A504XBY5_LEIDO|nr:hypothetical protein CGC20_0345 [Leishmania donovani]
MLRLSLRRWCAAAASGSSTSTTHGSPPATMLPDFYGKSFSVSPRAWAQITRKNSEEGFTNDARYLRLAIDSGGCHGYVYKFSFEKNEEFNCEGDVAIAEVDVVSPSDEAFTGAQPSPRVVVDTLSASKLENATLDYHSELKGSAFVVVGNELVDESCACAIHSTSAAPAASSPCSVYRLKHNPSWTNGHQCSVGSTNIAPCIVMRFFRGELGGALRKRITSVYCIGTTACVNLRATAFNASGIRGVSQSLVSDSAFSTSRARGGSDAKARAPESASLSQPAATRGESPAASAPVSTTFRDKGGSCDHGTETPRTPNDTRSSDFTDSSWRAETTRDPSLQPSVLPLREASSSRAKDSHLMGSAALVEVAGPLDAFSVTDATLHSADFLNIALVRPMESGHADAGASGRRHHRLGTLRRLFHKSPSSRSMTSQSDATSPLSVGRRGSSLGAAQNPEGLEDHMQNSIYAGTDTCMDCGFTRGSSVCCPVTRRHHGTDELIASGRHRISHSRFSSASKGIFTKVWGKHPIPHARQPAHLTRVNHGGITPTAEALHPLALGAEDATAEGTNGDSREADTPRIGGAGDLVSLKSGIEDRENGDSAHQHNGIDAREDSGGVDEAVGQGGGEVQYYCYTDEKGDTYWYVQELQDSMQPQQPAADAEAAHTSSQATTYYYESQTGQYWIGGSVPEGSYVCEYVDENGQTVYYLYTPEMDGAQDNTAATPQLTQDTNNDGTTSTPAIAATGSHVASKEAVNAAAPSKRKTPGAFFAAIKGVFKPHRSRHTRYVNDDLVAHDGDDADPSFFVTDSDVEPPAPLGTVISETLMTPRNSEVNLSDNDEEEFLEILDAAERKRLRNECKRRIKELAASEKKEREIIMKERRDDMATLGREKRAEAFVLRNFESLITKRPKRV